MKLLYFTATGNNLYIAKYLGGELISIPKMIKEDNYKFKDDKIGIIFPIYSNKVPPYIEDFIRRSKFECDYLFGIMSYGAYAGGSANHLLSIGNESGNKFSYINTIKMVDNWIPGFNMDKQIKNEYKKNIEEHLESIKEDIGASKEWILKTNPLDRFVTNHWIKSAKKFPKKESLHGSSSNVGIKPFINVQDTCIQCGICAKVCPVNNIKVDHINGKISLGNFCVSCFACTHNCPTNSIRMKGERSTARFRNKHVAVKEIIDSND